MKNRVHVCLRPDAARDGEVDRLLGLGATLVVDRREPDHSGWAVLADPDGNEFCVLRGPADPPVLRWARRHDPDDLHQMCSATARWM